MRRTIELGKRGQIPKIMDSKDMRIIDLDNWKVEEILPGAVIGMLRSNYRSEGLIIINSPLKLMGSLLMSYLPKVFDIRDEDLLTYAPLEGEYKSEEIELILSGVDRVPLEHGLLLITQGELINRKLYDKLLKTLEEPGKSMTIVLIVEDISSIPVTVLGRANLTIKIDEINEELLRTLLPEERKLLDSIRYDVEVYNGIVSSELEKEVTIFLELIASYQESEVRTVVDYFEEIADKLKYKSKDLSYRWEFLWRSNLHNALVEGGNYEGMVEGYRSFNRGRIYNSNFSLILMNFLIKKF